MLAVKEDRVAEREPVAKRRAKSTEVFLSGIHVKNRSTVEVRKNTQHFGLIGIVQGEPHIALQKIMPPIVVAMNVRRPRHKHFGWAVRSQTFEVFVAEKAGVARSLHNIRRQN